MAYWCRYSLIWGGSPKAKLEVEETFHVSIFGDPERRLVCGLFCFFETCNREAKSCWRSTQVPRSFTFFLQPAGPADNSLQWYTITKQRKQLARMRSDGRIVFICFHGLLRLVHNTGVVRRVDQHSSLLACIAVTKLCHFLSPPSLPL